MPPSWPGSTAGSSNSGHWPRLGHSQRAALSSQPRTISAALDQGGDLRQLPRGHLAEPLDGGLVIGRGGQQRPDLAEGEPRPLPGLDHRERAHCVRAVHTPPAHPGRRGQQPDLLVVPDRGRPPARQRGHRADGQSRSGI